MTEIPPEIMEEARAVRNRTCIDTECTFDNGCGCLSAISQALLAAEKRGEQRERERAAQVADNSWKQDRATGETIAKRIRSGT